MSAVLAEIRAGARLAPEEIRLSLPYPVSANRNSPCINTKHCLNAAGYGHVRYNGKTVRENRLVYALTHGLTLDDISGVIIRHTCDNPACINPDHLEPGTHTDNMRDMMQRGRGNQPKGKHNGRSKLTDEDVISIRERSANGETNSQIAKDFDIANSQVSRISTRKIWRHIP